MVRKKTQIRHQQGIAYVASSQLCCKTTSQKTSTTQMKLNCITGLVQFSKPASVVVVMKQYISLQPPYPPMTKKQTREYRFMQEHGGDFSLVYKLNDFVNQCYATSTKQKILIHYSVQYVYITEHDTIYSPWFTVDAMNQSI